LFEDASLLIQIEYSNEIVYGDVFAVGAVVLVTDTFFPRKEM
jgi:hypothetical protein